MGQSTPPFGEAWLVHDQNQVEDGPHAGESLATVTERYGEALLGSVVWSRGERTFPLLIKLLDIADWLSIQVHPDDDGAARLEASMQRGKTEAWFVLEAEQGATLIAGVKDNVGQASLVESIRNGTIADLVRHHQITESDSLLIPAGTVHALGPGLFVYEVQQHSDLTYRVYDWDRPVSAGRALHLEQSAAVARSDQHVEVIPAPLFPPGGGVVSVLTCPYFSLRAVQVSGADIGLETGGRSFHCVTAIDGTAMLSGEFGERRLDQWKTVVIPASAGGYRLSAPTTSRLLLASAA